MRLPVLLEAEAAPREPGVVTRADVVAEARSLVGVRYEHQHRDRKSGVDCVGLVIMVARALGLVDPAFDITGYPRKPDGESLLKLCDEHMDRVATADIKPGHVLVLAFRHDPHHLGILAPYVHGGFSLVHAYGGTDGKGRVEEWVWQHDRRAFRPLKAFALRGVAP